MLFNSFQFLLFFPIVTMLFFLLPHRFRWLLLLAASCGFYMAFIPIYILILFLLIIIDYVAGLLIEKSGFEGGRVFFTLGGADANEQAVKFARQASGRPHGAVIARDRSYHGASYGAMAFSGCRLTSVTVESTWLAR